MPSRRFPKRPSESPSPSPEALVERVDQQRPGDIPRDTIPTGFPSIDRLLGGGLRRRDLVVLGGDIGSGKSALALGLALRVAQRSEERRVGKEGRSRGSPYHLKKKNNI